MNTESQKNKVAFSYDNPGEVSADSEPMESIMLDYRIANTVGAKALGFIREHVNLNSIGTKVLHTSSKFNVESLPDDEVSDFVNIRSLNNIRYLNKFFEAVNRKIPENGTFIGTFETFSQRRRRIFNKYNKWLATPIYFVDFMFHRVFPKMKITRKIYFFLTGGSNRVYSLTEVLGRLVSCGFDIVEYKAFEDQTYFAVTKISDPEYNEEPSYGPLFRMRRIGKNGKIIFVYKFRTMHPYSEYLQRYLYDKHSLKEGGKINNDFRVTYWGRIMRKLWIDELPMFINFFKGDLKLVGVRPLSSHYLSLYDEELREMRIRFKPGLLPPFYADMPKTLEEIIDSEKNYLKEFAKYGIITDTKYLFKAMYNILIKRARSN
jgi:lipopolysaccharide/colanic/teichoic acid biosynthesis glycosyltransferase